MTRYKVEALQQVGLEGFWGIISTSLLILTAQFFPCSDPNLCPDGYIDSLSAALLAYKTQPALLNLSLFACVMSLLYNGFGLYVTKHASATQSCTIDISRTSLVWIFFLFVPINGVTEAFSFLQLSGFVLLTLGTLFFNEILSIPGIEAKGHHRPPLSVVDRSSFMEYSVLNLSDLNRRLLPDDDDNAARVNRSFHRP